MKARIAGILLIGFSLLTAVIAYSFNLLIDAIKNSASVVSGAGGSLAWGGQVIPTLSIVLIVLCIGLGIYLIAAKE